MKDGARVGGVLLLLVAVLVLPACSEPGAVTPAPTTVPGPIFDPPLPLDPALSLAASPVAEGLVLPLLVTAPPGDERLFIIEKPGTIRVVADGELLPLPFLDLTAEIRSEGNEQGLLGLAFHPAYADNGRLFVDYTNRGGDTRVMEFRVDPSDPARADPDSGRLVLAVDQPHQYHNGGMLQFGADGLLYVSFGDGGGIGDSYGHGQLSTTLLGSIVRLDVDGREPYGVPADNPFVDGAGGAPEVWVYGLRNPWRFWIDDRHLYVGDVGQEQREEINVINLDAAPGANFGWSVMEGDVCFGSEPCSDDGLVPPEISYDHQEGCAVVGGPVYRGSAIPGLSGHYFYADFCGGWVRSFAHHNGEIIDPHDWSDQMADIGQVLSFGTDAAGEIYITTGSGSVYRIDRGDAPE